MLFHVVSHAEHIVLAAVVVVAILDRASLKAKLNALVATAKVDAEAEFNAQVTDKIKAAVAKVQADVSAAIASAKAEISAAGSSFSLAEVVAKLESKVKSVF